jgi:acylphosphatase
MNSRAQILVSGMVQGVGFRFFVRRIAVQQKLCGWVKNLATGDVEIEVEGDKGLIFDFIRQLKIGPRLGHVTQMKVSWKQYKGEFKDFKIKFW